MNLKIGIVGLPNAGKSTLFNALLKKQVAEAANYPFTTIEPNIGVVPVPDARLAELAKVVEATEGKKPPLVPAVVQFIDIAGIVKGASQGEGLGNKFLSHIREVDLIVNVLRFFEDPSVIHVAGSVDANRDKEVVETELILADLQTLNKQTKPKVNAVKEELLHWSLVEKLKLELNAGKPAHEVITDPDEVKLVRDLNLLSMKPVLYVANVSEDQLNNSGNQMLKICAKTESELVSMNEEEQVEYLKTLNLESSGLDRLISQAYKMLGLISFLTCGIKEVRAWTIAKNTPAQSAAGVIHSDFAKKFIRVNVVSFTDFIGLGGWKKAAEMGKIRQEGKEYLLEDGEVVEFMIGT